MVSLSSKNSLSILNSQSFYSQTLSNKNKRGRATQSKHKEIHKENQNFVFNLTCLKCMAMSSFYTKNNASVTSLQGTF